MFKILKAIAEFFDGPRDKSGEWREVPARFPVRLVTGGWSNMHGQLSRRWNGTSWEYKQGQESEFDFDSRQW